MEALVPAPEHGRVYAGSRRIRLADRDARGRLRLDAIARYLQDVATDDVDETGWGAPEHLWVVRSMRIDVLAPPVEDDRVELLTWCSGTGTLAAGRRLSLGGDRGGRVEADSVWIHLGPDARPQRIERFGIYAESAEGRQVTTRLHLHGPAGETERVPWSLRVSDLDLMGHVNNAVYWQAVEECLVRAGEELARPLRARLDYRHPIDLGDDVELVTRFRGGHAAIAFVVGDVAKAVARVDPLA
jgi:acyl-ACP thioesterase